MPKQKPLYSQINFLNLILKKIHGNVLIYTESKGLKSKQTKKLIFFDHTSEYKCMLALSAAEHEHRKALESGWHSGLINRINLYDKNLISMEKLSLGPPVPMPMRYHI